MALTLKPIFDLLAKMARNNKDRMIGNDILELTRQIKGLEKTVQELFQSKIASGLEIDRMKMEMSKLKKGEASLSTGSFAAAPAAPAQPKPEAPPRISFEGAVYTSGDPQKK